MCITNTRAAFVVPPSFTDAARHQPLRVLPYSSPITGATGRVLLSHQAISSRSYRVFFTAGSHMGFPPTAHSLDATATVTRPFKAFALYGCYRTGEYITYSCTSCQGFYWLKHARTNRPSLPSRRAKSHAHTN